MQHLTTCINCQQQNARGAKFCQNCGALMEYACAACGGVSPQGSQACIHCGKAFRIAVQSAAPPPVQPAYATPKIAATPQPQEAPAPAPPQTGQAQQMEKVCSGCQAVNEVTSNFCYKCGLALGPPTPAASRQLTRAGFWIRLGAYLIDAVSLLVLQLLLDSILLTVLSSDSSAINGGTSSRTEGTLIGINLAVIVLYYTLTIGTWGVTIGKRTFGLVVVQQDGGRVGYLRAFFRALAYYVSWATAGVGFLIIAWNKEQRGLHDMLVGTIVIKRGP